ncbi:MAG: DUF87 domain-containing protein [Thermoanaerobaculia bacterium]
MPRIETPNRLILGWRVNRGLDPEYWLRPGSKLGHHSDSHLIAVPAAAAGNHTAIVAQSGSGKSFLLGRLLEEIALKTKARLLILDPNGDFLQIEEVAPEASWKFAGYHPNKRGGFLPTESRERFRNAWSSVSVKVRSASSATIPVTPFELPWSSLSPEFLNADLNPILASEVHHCHKFVQAVADLAAGKVLTQKGPLNVLEESEQLLDRQRKMPLGTDLAVQREILAQQYSTNALLDHKVRLRIVSATESFKRLFPGLPAEDLKTDFLGTIHRQFEEESIHRALELCIRLPRYISEDAGRIYFGRARRYEESRIFSAQLESGAEQEVVIEPPRLEIVDIGSIAEPEMRRLAVSSLIATEFDRLRLVRDQAISGGMEQDLRSPTFLVVDEAHNLIPGGDVDQARAVLREQFRTIAAEGRKYGFFLILVTQRPDKLDGLVVSECENKIVMKLGSQAVLETTRRMLGLDDVSQKLLEKTLEFDVGRGLLYGEWAKEGPALFYCAARRTKEGGRNLRPEHWAEPYDLKQSDTQRERV